MAFTSTLASLVVNVVVNTQRVQANLQQVQSGLNLTGQKATQAQLAMAKIRTVAAGLYIAKNVFNALNSSIAEVIRTSAELEQQFIHVKQAADFNTPEFEHFKEQFIDLVNELKFFKIGDLQRIAVVASQAGLQGSGNILKFSESVAKAAAVSESLDAEGMAKFLLLLSDKFKTGTAMTDFYANALGRLAMEFRTNEEEIVKVVTKITGAAQSFGLNEQQILAWSAAVRASGIVAERASGSLLDFFNVLSNPKAAANAATAVGINPDEFVKLIREKPNEALLVFLQKLGEYGKNSNQTLINAGFESKRTKDTLQQLAIEFDKVQRAMQVGDEGIKTTVDNQRKLQDQTESLTASLNRLDNAWTQLKNNPNAGVAFTNFKAGFLEDLLDIVNIRENYFFNSNTWKFERTTKIKGDILHDNGAGATINNQDNETDAEVKETEKALERVAAKEKKFNEQLEDLSADTLPETERKLQDLDNKFKRLAEAAEEDGILTDDRKKQLDKLNQILRENIISEARLKQEKENERDLKQAQKDEHDRAKQAVESYK
jgi:TP901 family phage tail tape measure protein